MSEYDDDYLDQRVETRTEYSVGTTVTGNSNSKGTTASGFLETSTNALSSKTKTSAYAVNTNSDANTNSNTNTSSAFNWWGGGTKTADTATATGVGSGGTSAYNGATSITNKIIQKEGIDHEQKVREVFSVLAQGVELLHYETANMIVGGKKNKKIVWMVSVYFLSS